MRYTIAAGVFFAAVIGSGFVAAGPPNPPPGGLKNLSEISGGHANLDAVERVIEVSPVFGGASPSAI